MIEHQSLDPGALGQSPEPVDVSMRCSQVFQQRWRHRLVGLEILEIDRFVDEDVCTFCQTGNVLGQRSVAREDYCSVGSVEAEGECGEYRLVFHQYCRYSYVLIPIDFEWLHFRVQVVFCVGSDVRQFDVSDFHHICE